MELLALNQYINWTNIYALKSVLIFNLHSCIHNAHSLSHTHTHLYLAELGKHKWSMQSIGMRMWKSLSMKILSRSFTSLGLRMLSVCPLYRIVQKKETKGGREKHSRKQQLLFFFLAEKLNNDMNFRLHLLSCCIPESTHIHTTKWRTSC